MPFVIRQFHNEQTLAEKLVTLRKDAHLTLSELAQKTKIQKAYLKAFETGAFHKLPDPIYARNYLKVYIQALGGNVDYYLDQFEQERGTCDFVKNSQIPRQRARAIKFLVASRFVKAAIFLFFLGTLGTYIGLEINNIISPPQLSITSPIDGSETRDATIIVKGKTEKGTRVKINGQDVLLLQDGSFEKEVALERGLNVLAIEGAKRYSHMAKQYRRIIFDITKPLTISNAHVDKLP